MKNKMTKLMGKRILSPMDKIGIFYHIKIKLHKHISIDICINYPKVSLTL